MEANTGTALAQLYDVHNADFLGSGAYCTGVFRCSQRATGRVYAVKVVSTGDAEQHQHAVQEIRILKELAGFSPHFVRLEDVFHTPTSVCLVMELLQAGNLQQFVAQKGKVSEGMILESMHQLLVGLVQLHTRLNVVHRDIKPDNIGVASESPLRLVLLDFGHAKYFGKDDMSTISHPPTMTPTGVLSIDDSDFIEPLHRQLSLSSPVDSAPCGSVPYLAPEVVGHLASEDAREPRQTTRLLVQKLDVFSVGVVGIYMFSAGYWLPFVVSGEQRITMDEMHSRMAMGEIRFPPRYFSGATPTALGFLKYLLASDPSQRPTAFEALRHPWFPHTAPAAAAHP